MPAPLTMEDVLAHALDKRRATVAVYCGARLGYASDFGCAAFLSGQLLGATYDLIYGGGRVGMMGRLCDGFDAAGAHIVGVMPDFLLNKERPHPKLSALHITDTMHSRKAMMARIADAFVVLAGGLGTLEEVLEVATAQQLGQHKKPIFVLNTKGIYTHLLHLLDDLTKAGFLDQSDVARFLVFEDILTLKNALDVHLAIA